MGTAFVHTVIDDHSRVAYAEVHDDETAATATAVLRSAVAWFAERGITVERVLSDNGSAYISHLWRDTCAELGIKHTRTRPYRPQTNGKIERFHRTLSDGWGYARCYGSESERRDALPAWLHEYNHHRPHTACGNKPPITRLTNLPGARRLGGASQPGVDADRGAGLPGAHLDQVAELVGHPQPSAALVIPLGGSPPDHRVARCGPGRAPRRSTRRPRARCAGRRGRSRARDC